MSYFNLNTTYTKLATGIALACLSPICVANATPDFETIEVTGSKASSRATDFAQLDAELKQVAGGTNLIDLASLPARQATLQDALGFEPGIMMQSFFGGNDQPRLNIRGSGVQSNPVNRGIQLLKNGLPINQADGSFVIGLVEPKAAEFISVYRGANGLRYGATTLGGAINFVNKTGQSGNEVRAEYGNNDRQGLYAQYGAVVDDHDVIVTASRDSFDGYRNHSASERTHLSADWGWQVSDTIDTRTSVQMTDNYFEIPFVVPKARALSNPKGILGDGNTPMDKLLNIYTRVPHRDSQLLRASNATHIHHGDGEHEIGVFVQQLKDTFTDPLKHHVTQSTDWGVEYAFDLDTNLVSAQDNFLVAVSVNGSEMSRQYIANNPKNGAYLQTIGEFDLTAHNQILALQWIGQMSERLQLNSAVQWVNSDRDISDKNAILAKKSQSFSEVNPKIGLNYQISESTRVFANISYTAEAPTFWELVSANVNPKDPAKASLKINDLQAQTSSTIEFGSQGGNAAFNWDVSLYRSEIEHEIISVVSDFAVNGETTNYQGTTIHQGIELQLKACLSHDLVLAGDKLDAKWVYNHNDFYFEQGKYQGNQIAGLPKHFTQLELAYTTAQGLLIAPSIKWQPDRTAIDHANTQYQDKFLLLALKFAYQVNEDWRVYADIENLTDKIYQSSYVIRGLSQPQQPSFLPGIGRSISVGVQFKW